jgi:peptidoglycan/xylan/chitin deacetylase (PgdA/CDA1 family)
MRLGLTKRLEVLSRRMTLASDRRSHRSACGIILLFHEVHEDDNTYGREFKSGCTAAFLDALVARLRRDHWDIISLDAAISRLVDGDTAAPFAVLTFDDGYRNTLTAALSVLERHAAPFTVYVPTGAITRELPSWWLGLRALFQQHDTISIAETSFECRDIDAKMLAHAQVKRWAHQDYRRLPALVETLQTYGISLPALNRRYFMDEAELKALASHPLVHIGAHSETHSALALLEPGAARCQIADNRRYLESLLDRPLLDFAYPYGGPTAFGNREVAMAADIGFRSAVTSFGGLASSRAPIDRYRLPRLELAGTTDALKYCFSVLQTLRSESSRILGVTEFIT